jgi:hypothetical protein
LNGIEFDDEEGQTQTAQENGTLDANSSQAWMKS